MRSEKDIPSQNRFFALVKNNIDPTQRFVIRIDAPSRFVANAWIMTSGYVGGNSVVKMMDEGEFAINREQDRTSAFAPIIESGSSLPDTDENAIRRNEIQSDINVFTRSGDYLKKYNTLWLKIKDVLYSRCHTFNEDFYNLNIMHSISVRNGQSVVEHNIQPKNLQTFLWINGVEIEDPYKLLGVTSYQTDIGLYYFDHHSGYFRFDLKHEDRSGYGPIFSN